VEQLVLTELARFFRSAETIAAELDSADQDLGATRALLEAGERFAKRLTIEPTPILRELLVGITLRVTICQESIEIHLPKHSACARLFNQTSALRPEFHEEPIVLRAPIKLKRCGGEMRLLIPGAAVTAQQRQPVPSLIKAISRATDWVRKMESGECKHQLALAKATGLEPRYINSILRVAFLAPEIVEAIIDGRQAPDLTLGSLIGVLPMLWREQKNLISEVS
jgi:hypothetical protein